MSIKNFECLVLTLDLFLLVMTDNVVCIKFIDQVEAFRYLTLYSSLVDHLT